MLTTRHPVDFPYTRPELDALFRYANEGEQTEYAETHPLPRPGAVGRGRNRGSDTISIAGRGADYLARRLARDHPDVFARLKAGAYTSVRAADDEGFGLGDLMAELGRLERQALGYVKHGDVPRGEA